jgi:signal transduction histidine kinase
VVPAERPNHLLVAVADGDHAGTLAGLEYPTANSLVAAAMETGHGIRLDSFEQADGYALHLAGIVDVDPVMAVPLSGREGPRGGLVVGRHRGRQPFGEADLDMAESFANQAAVAVELAENRRNLERLTLLEDRDRIARDLHDHVIQQLFAAGLSIQSVAVSTSDARAATRLTGLVADLDTAISQIRTSIFALQHQDREHPGVRKAVLSIADDVAALLGFAPSIQFAGPVDTLADSADVQAVVREGLTNTAKHAHASQVQLTLAATPNSITIDLTDDGIGIGTHTRRSGLDNLRQRAEHLAAP